MNRQSVVKISTQAENKDRTDISLGDAGTLLEVWHDWEGVALLRLMAGMPDAADRRGGRGRKVGQEGRFGWHRLADGSDRLILDRPLFGVRIIGETPEHLADGIEYLAQWVDRLLVEVEYQNSRTGSAVPIEEALLKAMTRQFALRPSGAPAGTEFQIEDDGPLIVQRPALELDDGDIEERRAALREPTVQDHRPVVAPRRRPR